MLENERQAKLIGKGLEAQLKITAPGKLFDLLKRHFAGLKEILNVSEVQIFEGTSSEIAVLPASGTKCARCWNFMPAVADYGIWQNVCTRCAEALTEMNIAPPQPQGVL